jgi:hypothetical protein
MKTFLLHLYFIFLAATTYSQAVSWELSAEPGNQAFNNASVESANFDNCFLTRGAGVGASTGAGSMNSAEWFEDGTPTTLAQAIDNGEYYEFRVETINCIFFNPTTIKIVLRSSATGPNTATLRCSSDGFTANIGTVTVTTGSTAYTFSESISPNSQSVTYRLYGYGGAAGGGTPSAGGTMRIGTSVSASDNDLEVFATTTTLQVAQVVNITVNDGASVPATVFTANVPGATFDWTRTPEVIGLASTSGTGNVPAFTADNNTGSPVTSTFTVNATVGSCESVDMVFTITVNPTSPCDLTATGLADITCNDNGTPTDPDDDYMIFTLNPLGVSLGATYTATAEIDIPFVGVQPMPLTKLNGSPATNLPYGSPVQLRMAAGTNILNIGFSIFFNVFVTDDASPTCEIAQTGGIPPPCSIPCNLSATGLADITCNDNGTPTDPDDDYMIFTLNPLGVSLGGTYTATAEIDIPFVGIQPLPLTKLDGSPATNLPYGSPVQLRMAAGTNILNIGFSIFFNVFVTNDDDPACEIAQTGGMPPPCSGAPPSSCEIIGFSFNNIGPCNDNGTPSDDSDDFFFVDIDVLYSNTHSSANLRSAGGDIINVLSVDVPIGTNLTHTFTAAKLRADGQITTIPFIIRSIIPPHLEFCSQTGTGPAVNSCSTPALCSIDNVVMQNKSSCDNNGTPNDPADDFYTADLVITFENPPTTGSLMFTGDDIVPAGLFGFAIANILAVGSPATFHNKTFRADGQTTTFLVEFTGAPGCSFSFTDPGVDFCSSVFTCPPNVTVECSGQGSNQFGVTSPCSGDATVLSISPSVTNKICFNNFDNVLTYHATDLCGNDGTCTQAITVRDLTPPIVTCPAPLTVSCASQVPAVDASVIGISDNCGGFVIGITRVFVGESISNQSCANRFTLTRTYQGGDECGNTATCSQTIAVNDQTKPVMTCPGNLSVSCASSVPPINTNSVTGQSDNCGGNVSISSQGDAITNQTCPNRFTILRTYFAVDVCGNSTNCIQTITVNDQTGPTLNCPAPQTVSCAEQVPAPNPALVTGTDNCGGGITPSFFSNTTSNQSCVNRFTVTRQYRAVDVCGNTSSCNQIITVNDQTPPVFTSVPANVTVDCYLIPGIGIATASDNCTSGATVVFLGEVESPGICPVFKILTRTWRATDPCGNSSTAAQIVTVTDSECATISGATQKQCRGVWPQQRSGIPGLSRCSRWRRSAGLRSNHLFSRRQPHPEQCLQLRQYLPQ